MKRHQLLMCGALALSIVALIYSTFAPSHTAAANPAFAPVTAVPLYRFYQHNYGFHFYTADPDERTALKTQPEWTEEQPEGYVFRQYVPGTVKLYRLAKGADNGGTQHLYTIDPAEISFYKANGWKDEGVACWVSPTKVAGAVPLYRLYFKINTPEEVAEATWYEKYLPLGAGEPFRGGGTNDDAWFYTIDGVAKFKAMQNPPHYQFVREEAYVWTQAVTLDTSTTPAAPAPIPESYYTGPLFNLGCSKAPSGNITCPSPPGYFNCEAWRKEGKIKPACIANFDLAVFSKFEAILVGQGCKRFVGRAGEYICQSWAGGEACDIAVKTSNGLITKCYTPRMSLVRSYQDSFGREPYPKEIAKWKGTWIQGTYPVWMTAHKKYLMTPAADNDGELKNMVVRNYLEVQGRFPTIGDSDYWRPEIATKGTSYAAMRKANIDWILKSDNAALLVSIIKSAFITAGKGQPTSTQIKEWVDKAHAQRLTFKLIVAKLKSSSPKPG